MPELSVLQLKKLLNARKEALKEVEVLRKELQKADTRNKGLLVELRRHMAENRRLLAALNKAKGETVPKKEPQNGVQKDCIRALRNLGLTPKEAQEAMDKAYQPGMEIEDVLIKAFE